MTRISARKIKIRLLKCRNVNYDIAMNIRGFAESLDELSCMDIDDIVIITMVEALRNVHRLVKVAQIIKILLIPNSLSEIF